VAAHAVAVKRLPGEPLAVHIRCHPVEKQTAIHADADRGVRIAAHVITQLCVQIDAGKDDSQRGVGPWIVVLVEPEVAEAAERLLALID
jgi:hypothetical protein